MFRCLRPFAALAGASAARISLEIADEQLGFENAVDDVGQTQPQQRCPSDQETCLSTSCGGSSNFDCYNSETHQCISGSMCRNQVCELGEIVCGGACRPEGSGVCCGSNNASPTSQHWHTTSENRQCCQGRCGGGGCETWDCDATTESCVGHHAPEWSADNPMACAVIEPEPNGCPSDQETCLSTSCGGSSNFDCYNSETHQCISGSMCRNQVCELGEIVCGGACRPEGSGVCCGSNNASPTSQHWYATSENRQCCQGRCQGGGCETWDCDAITENCVSHRAPDWSADNPMVCAVICAESLLHAGWDCYDDVMWAKNTGIHQNPEWYGSLTASNSFEDFHGYLSQLPVSKCALRPCYQSRSILPDSECAGQMRWAMTEGIRNHPEWYTGLSADSSISDFQRYLSGLPRCSESAPPCYGGADYCPTP